MKKIITFSAALMLSVCAFGVTHNVRAANADPLTDEQVTAMQTMMRKYIRFTKYTKKTRIYLNSKNTDFHANYFHANHAAQERTTYYYGEGATAALLMGDLDGTFTHINSGYANSGANMVHFSSQDGVVALSSSGARSVDYTVNGKNMADYFYDLNDLIDAVDSEDWGYSVGGYYHDIKNLSLDENGEYNDKVLQAYQYFAAPMLLPDGATHYLSPKSIVVNEGGGYLHICIYASDSDTTKLTSGSNLMAEAMIYADHVYPDYYFVGSADGDYAWQPVGGRIMTASSGDNLATLSDVTLQSGEYKVCKLNDDGTTTWYGVTGTGSGNINVNVAGKHNIYLSNGSGTVGHIYDEITEATFKFTTTRDVFEANAKVRLWAWSDKLEGEWIEPTKFNDTTLTFSINKAFSRVRMCRFTDTSEVSWSGTCWNHSGIIDLYNGNNQNYTTYQGNPPAA